MKPRTVWQFISDLWDSETDPHYADSSRWQQKVIWIIICAILAFSFAINGGILMIFAFCTIVIAFVINIFLIGDAARQIISASKERRR